MSNIQKKRAKPPMETVKLVDDDYDQNGQPKGMIIISWRTYNLMLGPQACWLAEYADLPGYFGEGDTVESALTRLKEDLGPRPHYRVPHSFRSPDKLRAAIRRIHKAKAAALTTRAHGWGQNLGGGEGVDETAKAFGVGKPAVNEARKHLALMIDSHPPIGISKVALTVGAAAQLDPSGETSQHMELQLWVARETPWRIEHAEARAKFPN